MLSAASVTPTGWSFVQNPNCKLTTLDIADTKIGADGAKSIAEALQVRTRLLLLLALCVCGLLSAGSVTPTGWSDVQNPNCKLTTLHIAYNEIGREGAESIAEALKVQST